MSEGEGAEQQQRYCTNCGAEIRPGTSFCVSCGVSLVQGPETHESVHEAATTENTFRAESLRASASACGAVRLTMGSP